MLRPSLLRRAVLSASLVLACACSPSTTTAQPPAPAAATPPASASSVPTRSPGVYRVDAFPAYSATATGAVVAVHRSIGGPVERTLVSPQSGGAPLIFLVLKRRPGWLQVQLPVRPNGTTGWVRSRDVVVAGLRYRIDVLLAEHRLELYRDGTLERTLAIGVGTAQTPTPGGTFYLKELLKPPSPTGPYGPYAYGLSGFSNTLTSFAGGDGVIGIHGTNEPAAIGHDVSHGCIRLRNSDITSLVAVLPLGTPVRILV